MATNNAINSPIPITVPFGGTGVVTFTANRPLLGEGTSAIAQTSSTGISGQLLLGSTSADPAWGTLTTTNTGLAYSVGANAVNIDIANYVTQTSFTPAIAFGGAAVGVTYGTQTGTYMRFMNMIFFTLEIVLTSKGSSTGTAIIGGLPVTIAVRSAVPVRFSKITSATGLKYQGVIIGTGINLEVTTATSSAALSNTAFANDSTFQITGHYFV